MSGRLFLDTNILVYAYDTHNLAKQEKAQDLLKEGLRNENAVISTQVLGEFYTVITRRITEPLTAHEAGELVNVFSMLQVVEVDLLLVKRAIETNRRYQISYWDALIVAAAERASCELIVTEDLDDGQSYHSIPVRNPFTHSEQ